MLTARRLDLLEKRETESGRGVDRLGWVERSCSPLVLGVVVSPLRVPFTSHVEVIFMTTCVCVCVRVCVWMCGCVFVHLCVSTYACVFVWRCFYAHG
jgi:hypothetical protein